jgi:hypothetical protein
MTNLDDVLIFVNVARFESISPNLCICGVLESEIPAFEVGRFFCRRLLPGKALRGSGNEGKVLSFNDLEDDLEFDAHTQG